MAYFKYSAFSSSGGGSGSGDVVGPSSATDNAVARYNGTTGKIIQNSAVTIDDSGNLAGVGTLNTHTIPGGTGTLALDPMTTRGDIIYRNASNATARLPIGTADYVLKSDGTDLAYGQIVNASVDASADIAYSKLANIAGHSLLGNATGSSASAAAITSSTNNEVLRRNGTLGFGLLVDANIDSAAAIAFSKMENLTVSRALVSDGSGDVSVSDITTTELGYLDGVSSNIQTQLGNKQDAIAASSNNRLARYSGTNDVQGSVISLDNLGNLTGVGTVACSDITSSGDIKTTDGQMGAASQDLGTVGATETVDWNNGNVQYLVMDVNLTLSFSNPVSGHAYTLILKQDGSGTNSVTWPSNVAWPGGAAPTITSDANAVDVVTLIYNNEDSLDEYYATVAQDFS